jgi:Polysaccharide lyase
MILSLRRYYQSGRLKNYRKASKKIPKAFKDGLLQVWKNGKQIVEYNGALGFKDDEDEIYFKMGLYRDHMQIPMCIIFDRFRRGKSFEEVCISER